MLHALDLKCVQNFSTNAGDLRSSGRPKCRWEINNYIVSGWTGFILPLKTWHLIFGFLIARGLLPPASRLSVSQGLPVYNIDLFISVFNISFWLFHLAEFYDVAFRFSSSHTHPLLRVSPCKFCLTEEGNCFSSRFQYLICLHAQPCNTLVRTSPVFF